MKKIIKVLLIILTPMCILAQEIEHAEPPFWWLGMQNTELQVMLHGENIARLKPVIDCNGVTVKQTAVVENQNYLFLYLEIGKDAESGYFTINLENTEGEIFNSFNYELLKRQVGSEQRHGYDNSDVMYLITPDRFVNGNPDNDAVKGMLELPNRENKWGRHGGDIEGIEKSLDYIEEMGFTSIWLNPILENNQEQASYHGYSTTDYYKVDPRFGSNEEYKTLSEKANEKGIKLIMDMIMNHCGSGHWWMEDLPSGNWINNPDNYFITSHRRTTLRDPYTSDYDLEQFTDGWFVPTMPDLNQRNPLLADYLIQNTIWWIEYLNLKGIRMDTYSYSDKDFMRDWTCSVMGEYPNFSICGEEWSLNPAVLAYWQKGKNNPDGYTSCLPGLLDFPLQNSLVQALSEEEQWNSGMIKLYEVLSNDFQYADPFKHVIFPDNHDMSRIFSQLNDDYSLFKLAMVYFTTMRGTPQFYYGTEILMSNTGDDSHGNIRSDFPGGWIDDVVNAFSGEGLTQQQIEAQMFVKKLLNWRKTAPAIHTGKLKHFVPKNGVYVYFRYYEKQKIMIVLNKKDEDQQVDLSQFTEMDINGSDAKDIITDEVFHFDDVLNVKARQPLVLVIQ